MHWFEMGGQRTAPVCTGEPWKGRPTDRYLLEWLLFLLVFLLSFWTAWAVWIDKLDGFFWCAYDGLGYYQWLPAVFVDGNVDWMIWTHQVAEGRGLSLFTMGTAILQLPFFLLGHGLAGFFDYPSMGYGDPYAVAQMGGAAVYTGLGSVLAYRLAIRFSNVPAALLSVLTIYGASNLFYYATDAVLMSHVYSFFLVTLFCWSALKVIDGPKGVHVVLFLSSGALLVLVRQVNALVLIFPLWMAWSSADGLHGAWKNLVGKRRAVILGLVLGLLPWMLQLFYWHHITGHWYVNAYAYKGEFFEFDKMVPGMVLFSPRNGWFVYSPVFMPVVAVLLVHAWRNTATARPILLMLVLTVLLYSAWWCWWLGGSYGYRGLIDLYGLLAIPLAWLYSWTMRRSWSVRITAALMVAGLVWFNFGMMRHLDYHTYSVNGEWAGVWRVVGEVMAGR